MFQVILALHFFIAFILVVLVLLQHGKGADAGANFGGGGSSQTTFGSGGGGSSVMLKITAVVATVFFVTSLSLAHLGGQQAKGYQTVVTQIIEQPEVDPLSPIIPE